MYIIEKNNGQIYQSYRYVAFHRPPVSAIVASQIRTVLSSEPDASRRPEWEKATELTEAVGPSRVRSNIIVTLKL